MIYKTLSASRIVNPIYNYMNQIVHVRGFLMKKNSAVMFIFYFYNLYSYFIYPTRNISCLLFL